MSPKQTPLALIAALFFITMVTSTEIVNNAAVANDTPLSTNILPSSNNTFSEARDPVSIICEVHEYMKSDTSSYDEVANHIRDMPSSANLGTRSGGGWCFIYSCKNKLAIYGCNDNHDDVKVPWANMASYADAIKDKCTTTLSGHGQTRTVVRGQAFDIEGWNVILGLKSGDMC